MDEKFAVSDIKKCLGDFAVSYDEAADNTVWFENIKRIAAENGFCPDVKAYKASPESYKGHVGDVSSFIRIAITGRLNSPDLYTVMQILGKERSLSRIHSYIESL